MNLCDGRYIFEFGIAITAQSLGKADNEYALTSSRESQRALGATYKQGNLVAPRIERTSIQFEGDC